MTSAEFNELLSDAPPPTADDVSITVDGERLDTKEQAGDREGEPRSTGFRHAGALTERLEAGDVLRMLTPSGGGWGQLLFS